jgi:hypothetical protein
MAKKASKSKAMVAKTVVAKRTKKRRKASKIHVEDHIDGCDFEFVDSAATPDAALPPTTGGVATVGQARRGSRPRL